MDLKKLKIVIICLPLLSGCANSNSSKEEIVKTILSLEQKALDEWSKGNPSEFPKNFASDATYFDDIAAQNRIEGIDEITTYFNSLEGKVPVHKYELINPKVQVYDDIAILTLKYNSTNESNESDKPWKATSVYRFTDGNWKIVHANWSLIKE